MDSRTLLKRCLEAFENKSTGSIPLVDVLGILELDDTDRLKLVITRTVKNTAEKAVAGNDLSDLMDAFGLGDVVSKTQFERALGSLHKDKKLKVERPSKEPGGISDYPVRTFLVSQR